MKIVIPDYVDLLPAVKDKIREMGGTLYEDTPKDESVIIERIKDAEIITANYIDITANIIDNAPKLKYIIAPAVGYEWIDYKHAASKGIQVINCPTHNATAVAEHAIALLFAVKRKLVDASVSMRAGEWNHENFKGTETHGKKLGLMGYGKIAKKIEAMAKGLGMSVDHVNSSSSADEIDELLRTSDVVCMCLPLNDGTRGILDQRRLGLLQPHSILINVGRGATIDQKALINTLRDKKIAGAGLDVFVGEPFGDDPLNEDIPTIASQPNVVTTPHSAYNTAETAGRLGEELIENLEACVSGRPTNVVS